MNKDVLFILINPVTVVNFYDILFKEVSLNYNVHILTDKTYMTKEIEELDFDFHYFDVATEEYFDFFKMNYSIYKTIKKVQPNLVIGFTIRNTIFGNLISHFLKIPTISPIVGIGMLFKSNDFFYKIARFLLPFALKKTNHVFFYNEDDMNLFLSKNIINNKSSYSIINGVGVNIKKFKPLDKNENEEKIIFLLIARLLYDKGINEYYKAAKIVLAKHQNVRFQLLGHYYEKNLKSNTISKETIEEWENEGVIEYLGGVDDIRPFVANSDCVVLPSYREGLSNVLMESASMKKPLLASNVPGCKELIIDGYNGYKFSPKSAKDLSRTIFKFLSLTKEDYLQMGNNSRTLILEKFDRYNSVNYFNQKINDILK